jgi:hypothetical protein
MVSFPSEMFDDGRIKKSSKTPTDRGRDSGWGCECGYEVKSRPEWVERLTIPNDGRQAKKVN